MSVAINGTNGITYNDGSLQPSAPVGKNLIINGNMQIAQRATSTSSITNNGYHTVDRFQTFNDTMGTWTQSQSTTAPSGQGFATSLKMDCTTADASPSAADRLGIRQRFEGYNIAELGYGTASAQTTTLSFWVRSNKTGTYIAELYGVTDNRQISKSYTISSADTWEKKTITFVGDTGGTYNNDNSNELIISWYLGAGSNYTSGTLSTTWGAKTDVDRAVGQVNLADSTSNEWYITGVQLEAGTTATPFEHLQYGQQLALCKRYYEHSYPYGTVAGTAGGNGAMHTCVGLTRPSGYGIETVFYTVEKRATATVVLYAYNGTAGSISNGDNGATIATADVIQNSTKGFLPRQTGGTTLAAQTYIYHYSASSEL